MWDGATVAMLEALVVLCVLLDGKSSCSWFLSSRTDNSTRDKCCVASLPLNPVIDRHHGDAVLCKIIPGFISKSCKTSLGRKAQQCLQQFKGGKPILNSL